MDPPAIAIEAYRHSDPHEQLADRIVIHGERRWLLKGEPAQISVAAAALGRLGERFGDTLLLSCGNTVGRITVPGLGLLEIRSGKWGDEHFEQMLTDLSAEASALPFSVDQPTGFPYDRSVLAREQIPYHLFVYLRHVLSPAAPREERLLPALEAIVRQPHQRFEDARRDVPLAAARRVDQPSLLRIAAGVGGLLRAEGVAARTPLAQVLGGHIPRVVNERQVTHSLDTLENRFVKSFLRLAMGVIERMRRDLSATKTSAPFRAQILDSCGQMERALAPFVHHTMWDAVGAMTQVPTGSTVLQGRRGYREVYRHFVRLRLAARIPIDDDALRDLLEARDIALLYELWCYFTMVRLVTGLLGPPRRADRPSVDRWRVEVPHRFEVRWANGVRLRYNPHYVRGHSHGSSYSVPLRPDIALHLGGPSPRIHLFDAKFRLDKLAALLPAADAGADELAEEAAEERRGTFKRADLYKMHTYRDAIAGTKSVWVLYPGSESRFYACSGQRHTLPDLPSGELAGVGGVALRPEPTGDETLRLLLAQILGVAGPAT